MKTFLTILFSLSLSLLYAQAGSDKQICLGSTTQIGDVDFDYGNATPVCYQWTPATNLSSATQQAPYVQNLQTTAKYTVKVFLDDGNVLTDEVIVMVYKLNLLVYRPPSMDGNSPQIPLSDAEEINPGVQTFENIDNDDQDGQYDLTDPNVSPLDDELIKVNIKYTPVNTNNLPVTFPQTVPAVVNIPNGFNNIRLWQFPSKQTAYLAGSPLDLSASNGYERNVYIEGVMPHKKLTGGAFEFSRISVENADDNGVTPSCKKEVMIRVLGIQSMKWVGIGNSVNSDDNLDFDDPNMVPGDLKSYRVFPDSRFVEDSDLPFFGVGPARDLVKLQITLFLPPVETFNLYLRNFDIDDPSNQQLFPANQMYSDDFIDPNDKDPAVSGIYPGKPAAQAYSFSPHSDNRSESPGQFVNLAQAPSLPDVYIVQFAANQSATNIPQFKVSQFPGDNYRVAAYIDPSFLADLENIDFHDQMEIVDPNTVGRASIRFDYESPVLTVWRNLHMEIESMAETTSPSKNQYKGHIVEFIGSSAASITEMIPLITWPEAGIGVAAYDESLNRNTTPMGNGRFENGIITIGQGTTPPFLPFTRTVSANGNFNLFFDASISIVGAGGLWCTLSKPGSPTVTVGIVGIKKVNGKYRVSVVNSLSLTLSNYLNGTVALGGSDQSVTINAVLSTTTFEINQLFIPFSLVDDDPEIQSVLPYELSNAELTKIQQAYSSAYILPTNDHGGHEIFNSSVPLLINVPSNPLQFVPLFENLENNGASIQHESNTFWAVYVVFGWQLYSDADGDPNDEYCLLIPGVTTADVHDYLVEKGGDISLIALETKREMNKPDCDLLMVAHEIGHQFGLSHGVTGDLSDPNDPCSPPVTTCLPTVPTCPNTGLMNPLLCGASEGFIPQHINLMRSRTKSPGSN